MGYWNKMGEASGLVSGMAERLGIDLSERIAGSPDTQARNYAAMVMRCAACRDHAACTQLQEDNPMLDNAPDYCLNKNTMKRS